MTRSSKSLALDILGYWRSLACLLLLAFIVHLTADKINHFLPTVPPASPLAGTYIPLVKATLFLLAMIVLALPVGSDLRQAWSASTWRDMLLPLAVALGISAISMALTFQRGPLGLGVDYSLKSVSPFNQIEDWQSTRLLMPALSYFLFLRGTWPFYGFFLALTVLFIAVLYAWMRHNAKLSLWEFLSLCTVSFVSFQFQVPGYPDVLVYLFFLLVMQEKFSPASKLSLLLLALIANETSFFVGLVLAWRYLSRKEQVAYLIGLGLYVAVWVALSNFDVGAVLASRNVEGMSGMQWVLQNPLLELFGIFMGYKALWLLIGWAVVVAFRSGRLEDAKFIIATLIAAVLMTLSAVDTSRLMGYAFPALLISVSVLKNTVFGKFGKTAFALIFIFNLLIPSVYVGLNAGVRSFRGLYGRVYEILFNWAKRFAP
jgi:hypothetical protein